MFAILSNAVLFILLTIQPVSLKQVMRLKVPAIQLVAFGFHGILLGLALALHSQTENFDPITPAIEYMYSATSPCLLFVFVAFAINITIQRRPVIEGGVGNIEAGDADHRTPAVSAAAAAAAAAAVGAAQQYGAMIPYRVVMAAFTASFLALEACPVGDTTRAAFGPLSFAAVVFHIWMRAEDASVSIPVGLHFFAHASSKVIRGVRHLCDGDFGSALLTLIYIATFYPGSFIAATRFRSSVRSHGHAAAAKLAAVSFVAFWSAVVPVILYLGTDSLGRSLPLRSLLSTVVTRYCMRLTFRV